MDPPLKTTLSTVTSLCNCTKKQKLDQRQPNAISRSSADVKMKRMMSFEEEIPTDVFDDIFFRLPMKTLVRFRCVSKPWLRLITYSRFPYRLLNRQLCCDHSSTDCKHNEPIIIFSHNQRNSDGSGTKLFAIGGGYEEDSFRLAQGIEFSLFQGKDFEIMTNSCDGMLCLAIKEEKILVLWNPSTREHRALPLTTDSGICGGVCGLGFDSKTDDYKVVSVVGKQVYVFSLKRNSWRYIGESPYPLHMGIPANGYLYWGAGEITNSFANRIVCLDLSDDTFREVQLPSSNDLVQSVGVGQTTPEVGFYLLTWSGALFAYREQDQSVWMLKEVQERDTAVVMAGEEGTSATGVKHVWTKLMNIPQIPNSKRRQSARPPIYYKLYPKCFSKNGKLVMAVRGKRFILYDPKEKSYEEYIVRGLDRGRCQKAIACVESLISPNSIRGMNDID
ncbi:hypothetical protein K2173_021520 [Erythroxylum novogranatense]|uniref:F-box domain-containing protein n=1 Tax=Erythroxylum novogranatense TaxID=1862640 RepID=A0AAV8TN29_9ROSI|nr:hypothetical protein K2173_021520 [Erythroxylum novogranatense]